MAYASRTGTRRNLDALRAAGWRLLVSASGVWRTEGFPYALDNGAWTAHQQGTPFDEDAFRELVWHLGARADFVVAPDIVMGGLESLWLSRSWLGWLLCLPPEVGVLVPVQNGMTPDDLRPVVNRRVGVFVGGDTEWKEASLPMWGRFAAEAGCYLHVGRVNSARRIHLCAHAGADSFDGSSASRYAVELPGLDAARRQGSLLSRLHTASATPATRRQP